MKVKKIKTVEYHYGDEEKIKRLVYKSKEPLLLKINNFPDTFSLDYYQKRFAAHTSYSIFEDGHFIGHQAGNFKTVLGEIKKNKPYRIFAHYFPNSESHRLEEHVPLWQTIPFRPRYFKKYKRIAYFFGGKGSHTDIHFDREHCCNFHLCLSGKKRVLLFTQDQSDAIYKVPFIGDSLIDFSRPLDELCKQFPRLKDAEGYVVELEQGDMLFMPRNCWHYTEYLDASSAATYVFYPQKILQIYGLFTGDFYVGYKGPIGFKIYLWPVFQKFSEKYALATGLTKYFYKLIENLSYALILPIISVSFMVWEFWHYSKNFFKKRI